MRKQIERETEAIEKSVRFLQTLKIDVEFFGPATAAQRCDVYRNVNFALLMELVQQSNPEFSRPKWISLSESALFCFFFCIFLSFFFTHKQAHTRVTLFCYNIVWWIITAWMENERCWHMHRPKVYAYTNLSDDADGPNLLCICGGWIEYRIREYVI